MKPSILTLSFIVYILGFLILMIYNPFVFTIGNGKNENDKCFLMFFLSGCSAIFVYNIVSIILSN